MLANMAIVERAVTNFMRPINGVVDIVDSVSEFITDAHFALPFLTLFDQVKY